ncbi:MAG: hypothetical protein JWM80_762 [Cyanobacteria bacterium RYN_339]|nr:hypothetical protein [Cyanobacteria bacterium RYN_339]
MRTTRTIQGLLMVAAALPAASCATPMTVATGLNLDTPSQAYEVEYARGYVARLRDGVVDGDKAPGTLQRAPRPVARRLQWPTRTRTGEAFNGQVRTALLNALKAWFAAHQVAPPPTAKPITQPTARPTPMPGPTARPTPVPKATPTPVPPAPSVEARLLVISADGNEPALSSIQQSLGLLGTPYTVWIATQHPAALTPDQLATGDQGRYQGVILTDNTLSTNQNGQWVSALGQAEWDALTAYEAAFDVRQVDWYAFPSVDLGFQASNGAVDTTATPLATKLTAAGNQVFGYMPPNAAVTIKGAYTYTARAASATPLLVDVAGNALAATTTTDDGREVLALTFDNSPYLTHSQVLAYGLVNWVTRGTFLGDRHTYASAQVDDVFIDNFLNTVGPDAREPVATGGTTFRLAGTDIQAFTRWQQAKAASPVTAGYKTDLAFNGRGTTAGWFLNPEKAVYQPDTLVPALTQFKDQYKWVSHTYSHFMLDAIAYDDFSAELIANNGVATGLSLPGYDRKALVTPNVSGLANANAMKAAYDQGVRYLVSDTSVAGQDNPSPNAGIPNALVSGLLEIPRHPTNLFYNVSTPAEWADEYNKLYRSYWGKDLSYDEILEDQANALLAYLLKGDVDPWMFHQPNMRAYDGTHSLLGDLLDRTFAKYGTLMTFPIESPTMEALAESVAARMAYDAASVKATIMPGRSITLRADRDVVVPVMGLGRVSLQAGQARTLLLP